MIKINIYVKEIIISNIALTIDSLAILRLYICGFLPKIIFTIVAMTIKKVVVLIPPPVEHGEAPMNIRISIIGYAGVSFITTLKSTVEKPAVRAVTEVNNASSVETFIETLKRIVGIKMRTKVVIKTIFV